MSVQEMRKVMSGFNNQMNDDGTVAPRSRVERDESTFAPSRVNGEGSSDSAYLRSLPEEDDEFDEQVLSASSFLRL